MLSRCFLGIIKFLPIIGVLNGHTLQDAEEYTTNLAFNKRVVMSSVYRSDTGDSCVDGYLSTVCHTELEPRPYLWIDLGKPHAIRRIDVFNRNNNGFRLHHLEVSVGQKINSMHLCGHFPGPGYALQHIVIRCKLLGRYVKLQITSGYGNYLHLSEVKVFGIDNS